MNFENLTKDEKLKYWKEIESDIHECLLLCESLLPVNVVQEVKESLNSNELGLALEYLSETVIEKQINISGEAKSYILNTFMKMNYHNDHKDVLYTFTEYFGEI